MPRGGKLLLKGAKHSTVKPGGSEDRLAHFTLLSSAILRSWHLPPHQLEG